MTRCVRPRQEWGRGQNTRMGGSDPTAPLNRGPVPAGFGGHSRLKLLRKSQLVFWPRGGSSNGVVRQPVVQNCKGGIKRKNGNHQSTTQTTEDNHDPGSSRRVGEGTARSVCRVHRLLYVLRHHRSSETSLQTRRRVQNLARPTHQRRRPQETRRRRPQ